MKKTIKIVLCVFVIICVIIATVLSVVYFSRGSLKNTVIPDEFSQGLAEKSFENTADIRIMSSNLLVHYDSWGGKPAKPRAKQFIKLVEAYKPDVIGVQELCDSWYCCVKHNLPDGYKMLYPFSTGAFVRMTAMIYNSNTLNLVESGNFAYEQGDNPRLRRVVWAVFEIKKTGEQFAVTNTHLDLLREGREEELTLVMKSQALELSECIENLSQNYDCPVVSVGDFNTMEDTPYTNPIDIPDIYNTLAGKYTDAKFSSKKQVFGNAQEWDYPSYDHIFINGGANAEVFALLSYDYLTDMSDHYPIFADISINSKGE